jgi:uncharacterized protein (DUF1778 family)
MFALRREAVAVASKTQRIEMRTDPDSQARIAEAAHVSQRTVSAFVLEAATSAADRVLARADQVLMPGDQFDDLIASLDEPDAAPNLVRAARRERRFSRR